MCIFDGKRYITRGVECEIGKKLQLILWDLLDSKLRELGKLDYLQVFNLQRVVVGGRVLQKIEHSQEVPLFRYTVHFEIGFGIDEKVYVIDNGHVVMQLASEY